MSEALPAPPDETADVVVVGAGPGGSATAAHLAGAGLDVLLLEQEASPRERVGDALTPRAVNELAALGVPTHEGAGWRHTAGLRIVGGGSRIQLEWPDLTAFPPYGLVRVEGNLHDVLAQHAVARGARLRERTQVTGATRDENGQVVGVRAVELDDDGTPTGRNLTCAAPLVIAADGAASCLAEAGSGAEKRPVSVAVRARYAGPRHDDPYVETWLDLPGAGDSSRGPGRGWIVGLGDGTCAVGYGLRGPAVDVATCTHLMQQWVATLPQEWTFNDDTMVGSVEGAVVPTTFGRSPFCADGLLRVGDAAGTASPITGDGVAYALESGRRAAEVVLRAGARLDAGGRERVLATYRDEMNAALGGGHALGRGLAMLVNRPEVMRLAVKYGLPHEPLTAYALKMAANLSEPHGGSAGDRVRSALSRLAPAA